MVLVPLKENYKMTKEKQKQEAIKRMNILKLHPDTIEVFKTGDVVFYSESLSRDFQGILYWVSNKEDFVKVIKDFETKYEALVYHAILGHYDFGTCLSLLYVSNNKSEWTTDRNDLKENITYAYVHNFDVPDFSEFGIIGLRPVNGGIVRIA